MGPGKRSLEMTTYCVFETSGKIVGIPIQYTQEIIFNPGMTRVPQAPDWVLGVVQVRGEVVPVYSLNPFVGGFGNPSMQAKTSLLVVNFQNWIFCVPVGETHMMGLGGDQLHPFENRAELKALEFQSEVDGNLIHLISLGVLKELVHSGLVFQLN